MIYRVYSCLIISRADSSNPSPVPCNPLFITKWIDYSNKYGFGFQLSDRSVGVRFNDSTGISYSGDRRYMVFSSFFSMISRHVIYC